MKKLTIVLVLVLVVAAGWFVFARNDSNDAGNDQTTKPASFDKQRYSLTDPSSPWVIANKLRPLNPQEYQPDDLRAPDVPLRLDSTHEEMQLRDEAASAVEELFAAAEQEGIELMVSSAFRSYDYQSGLYNTYVRNQGQATADTQSARPGYSEHQTGWAVDVGAIDRECEIEECFADTPEGKWVAANAHKFGFVLRYQHGMQDTTGYIFEPWHFRYVGRELAAEVKKQGNPTLEAFFGLPAAPSYR